MSINKLTSLTKRVAFISGASRGIGASIAKNLASQNCIVVLAARTMGDINDKENGSLCKVAQEINEKGGTAKPICMDITDENSCENAIKETIYTFGKIDFLINNAGAMWWKPVLETPVKRLDLMNNVNFRGTYALSYLCLPYMLEKGYGHIINHSPPLTEKSFDMIINGNWMKNKVAYSPTKISMSLFSKGLANELKSTGIAVNTIWPKTAIRTAAMEKNKLGDARFWRKPEIMADMVSYLVREDNYKFTGNFLVDEPYLRYKGITDFTKYRCDPEFEPPSLENFLN